METPEIRYLGDLSRLKIKPGDRFVLKVPGPVSFEMAARIKDQWKAFVGGDSEALKLMIIENGMELGVVNISELR